MYFANMFTCPTGNLRREFQISPCFDSGLGYKKLMLIVNFHKFRFKTRTTKLFLNSQKLYKWRDSS